MSVQRAETLPARRMRTTQEEIEAKEQELQKKEKQGHYTHTTWGTVALAYSSLGIIYGDIGTSPLYCFATTLYTLQAPQQADVLGVASLIFWIMTLIVLVKYVLIVLRADDNGEGGTFALYSLLCRSIGLTPFGAEVDKSDCGLSRYSSLPGHRGKEGRKTLDTVANCMNSHAVNRSMRHAFRHSRGLQMALLLTVVLATAMVVGDGILTPSISVMGAIDGLKVATDNISQDAITGISCVVLVLLFVGQRYGTSMVGRAFAPVVIIWLSMNACLGIYNLSLYGGHIFRSLNPWLIVEFFTRHGHQGWLMLGGVMLCITGAEAMYSDLGHFTRQAVSLGFITFVYPCLMLTYWGQGAYLLSHPEHAKEAFWKSVPDRLFWPFFVLAILASVVASQALISGAFSIMRQASALGLFPKMTIVHTGRKIEGQIYMPGVNYTLMVLCVAVTVGFQSTHSLGEAYGVAVMTVMTFTTLLLCLVMLMTWNLHPLLVAPFVVVYLPLEGAFLSATLVKVPNGGWVALVVAAILGSLKMTWWWGTNKKHQHNIANKSHIYDMLKEVDRPTTNKLGSFRCCSMLWNHLVPVKLPKRQVVLVATGEPVSRMPGLGVYYSETSGGVPAVMQHVLETMPALYSSMVFMTVRFVALPTVDKRERFLVRRDKTISSCYHATVRYGYLDRVDHSQVFMEDLVQMLLQHLLDRRAVGSPGAAQRLISAIAAKAAAMSSASSQGDMEALAEGFATGALADVSGDGAGHSFCGIARALTAAAAAVQSMAGANNSSPASDTASGILSELLSQMTAADLLAILQPVPTTLSSRRMSVGKMTPTQKVGSGVGLAAVAAGLDAAELLSLGGSIPAAVDALGCITIRVPGDPGDKDGEGAGGKEVGTLELTPHSASMPRRASAELGEEDSFAFEASETIAEPDQVAAEPAPVPETSDDGAALRRLPSYWGQLQDAAKSAADSDDDDDDEPHDENDHAEGQQHTHHQTEQHQQPVPAIMVSATTAISDIMSPVSTAIHGTDIPRIGHRLSGVGTATNSVDDNPCIGLVQLSNSQITALQEAVRLLEDYHRRWVHCIGRTTLKVLPGGRFAHKVALGGVYRFMATNSRQVTAAWNIPTNNLIELGMDVEV